MTATAIKPRTRSRVKAKMGVILDVGCGKSKAHPNAVGMDVRPYPGVDVVHDWNKYPWPFERESVLSILAIDVVEHVPPVWPRSHMVMKQGKPEIVTETRAAFVDWMNECWRILRPEGQIAIATPYAGSSKYWADPTHCNPCTHMTFWYFDPAIQVPPGSGETLYGFYEPAPWKIESVFYKVAGSMEISLRKRPDDRDYHHDSKLHSR